MWNTVYLEKAVDQLREKDELDVELLQHISPLGWEHINFLGEYHFDAKEQHPLNSLRSLKK